MTRTIFAHFLKIEGQMSNENKMKMMMLEIANEGRKPLLEFQNSAFEQVQSAQQKANFNHLMFSTMNLAFWLRTDLELLLRVAYWQDLSENDFGARFIADQVNFYKTTLNRMEIDEIKSAHILDNFTKMTKNKNITPIKPESNETIIENLVYRKDELGKLFGCFHKALSKVAHPDPFFMCFPEQYRNQIETNLMNIFKLCKVQLDQEWKLLEVHLRKIVELT